MYVDHKIVCFVERSDRKLGELPTYLAIFDICNCLRVSSDIGKLRETAPFRRCVEIELERKGANASIGCDYPLRAIVIDAGHLGSEQFRNLDSQKLARDAERHSGLDDLVVSPVPIVLVCPPLGNYGDAIVVNTYEELEAALRKILAEACS